MKATMLNQCKKSITISNPAIAVEYLQKIFSCFFAMLVLKDPFSQKAVGKNLREVLLRNKMLLILYIKLYYL
jgi:hypothetical protein